MAGRESCDGKQALLLARSVPIDLIVMDCRMPVLGGEETLVALRGACARTLVVMVSAWMDEQLERRLLAQGARRCLSRRSFTERSRRRFSSSSRCPPKA